MTSSLVSLEHEIIVNGRPRKWAQPEITFEQVVQLAFPDLPLDPNRVFTVAYKKGHDQGTLVAGQSVTVQSGMIFNAAYTDKG